MRIVTPVSAILLVFIVAPAVAATLDVAVGQNASGQAALAFNPPTLTIHVNDTVRFTNAGGIHNVDTYGASVTAFHCSDDCSSNNGPSSNAWVSTVTFASAGTVTYHCDLHGTITGSGAGATCSGMCGTISVLSSVPVRLQSFEVN